MAKLTQKIKKTIGLDLDDTIIDHDPNRKILARKTGLPMFDDSLKKDLYAEMALSSPPIKNSLEVIKNLIGNGHRVIIVSRNKTPRFSRQWLKRYLPEIKPRNIFFVKEDKDKVKICRQEKVTFFVDDRTEVLKALDKNIVKIFFNRRKRPSYGRLLTATSWLKIKKLISKN